MQHLVFPLCAALRVSTREQDAMREHMARHGWLTTGTDKTFYTCTDYESRNDDYVFFMPRRGKTYVVALMRRHGPDGTYALQHVTAASRTAGITIHCDNLVVQTSAMRSRTCRGLGLIFAAHRGQNVVAGLQQNFYASERDARFCQEVHDAFLSAVDSVNAFLSAVKSV